MYRVEQCKKRMDIHRLPRLEQIIRIFVSYWAVNKKSALIAGRSLAMDPIVSLYKISGANTIAIKGSFLHLVMVVQCRKNFYPTRSQLRFFKNGRAQFVTVSIP